MSLSVLCGAINNQCCSRQQSSRDTARSKSTMWKGWEVGRLFMYMYVVILGRKPRYVCNEMTRNENEIKGVMMIMPMLTGGPVRNRSRYSQVTPKLSRSICSGVIGINHGFSPSVIWTVWIVFVVGLDGAVFPFGRDPTVYIILTMC